MCTAFEPSARFFDKVYVMEEVTFHEPEYDSVHRPVPKKTGLTSWMIRKGYAKDEVGAARILIIIIVVAVVLMIALFIMTGEKHIAPVEF